MFPMSGVLTSFNPPVKQLKNMVIYSLKAQYQTIVSNRHVKTQKRLLRLFINRPGDQEPAKRCHRPRLVVGTRFLFAALISTAPGLFYGSDLDAGDGRHVLPPTTHPNSPPVKLGQRSVVWILDQWMRRREGIHPRYPSSQRSLARRGPLSNFRRNLALGFESHLLTDTCFWLWLGVGFLLMEHSYYCCSYRGCA